MNDYIEDAREMLGKGYNEPSIQIEPAQTILERRNGKMHEIERAAFVKISTAFKSEMKEIDSDALKVWLYIALCVNRGSGKANPGLRKIHEETGLAVNTIRKAIEKLESVHGLLIVGKESRKLNEYQPLAFVSANHHDPVSPDDTDLKSVSRKRKTVSKFPKTVLRKRQKTVQPEEPDKPDIQKVVDSANAEVDAILKVQGMAPGKSWTKLPECYHDYGKVFCAATGIVYAKSDLYKWMAAFDTWQAKGYVPNMALEAIEELKAEGRAGNISGPSSITWKLDAMQSARHAREEKSQAQQQERAQVPEEWLRLYEPINS